MPHGASPVMSAPVINLMPHVMDQDDIDAFVREYAASARLSLEGRADGVEVHLNHDDIHEWFLSPLTNQRTDRYGGSLENRCRFAVETLQAIRDEVGSALTVGVRLNIREEVPGGYEVDGGVEIAQYLESTGLIDYVHGVVGSPWGNPSYIQPTYFDPAQWSALAGELTAALSIPVVHTGRINGPDVAERVLAAGHADIVGMARAHIADGRILQKAREGRVAEIRPCVGGNECISRRYVEGLGFACAVNPRTSHEVEGPWPTRLGFAEPGGRRRRPGRDGARRADARVRVRRDALGGRGRARRTAAVRGHGATPRDVCGLPGLAGTSAARPRSRREAGSSSDGRRGRGARQRRRGGGDGRHAAGAADPGCRRPLGRRRARRAGRSGRPSGRGSSSSRRTTMWRRCRSPTGCRARATRSS